MPTQPPNRSRFVLFWDHIISPSNPYELAVFSQWFDAPFIDPQAIRNDENNHVYRTAEHWMMYHKAKLFDPSLCGAILDAETPAEAKKLGREIKNFDRDVWNKHADGIVRRGNWCKFHPASAPRHVPAREGSGEESGDGATAGNGEGYEQRKADARKRWETLRATKGDKMVEASPEDRIWGIGYGREDAWDHPEDWGLNRMGNALTLARAELLHELGDTEDDPVPDMPSSKP